MKKVTIFFITLKIVQFEIIAKVFKFRAESI